MDLQMCVILSVIFKQVFRNTCIMLFVISGTKQKEPNAI